MPTDAALLVEYEAAQNSAQHHDGLVWSTTNVIWAASIVLLGFALDAMKDGFESNWVVNVALLAVSGLGIVLNGILGEWTAQLRDVKRQKYKRCKEIEDLLVLGQHTTLDYKAGAQTRRHRCVRCAFIVVWAAVALLAVLRICVGFWA
jgi:hypothetical protein